MKGFIKTLAAVFVTVMIIGLIPHTAITARAGEGDQPVKDGKSIETAIDILVGDNYDVSLDEEDTIRWFKFTPSESANYSFYSSNKNGENADSFGELYNSDKKMITNDDENGGNGCFKIEQPLFAGCTYYYAARMYSAGYVGDFSVSLVKAESDEVIISANNSGKDYDDVFVSKNGSTTLKVNIITSDTSGYSYKWYYYDTNYNEYIASDKETCFVDDIKESITYYCDVKTPDDNTISLTYNIYITNHLKAFILDNKGNIVLDSVGNMANSQAIDVDYNSSVELKVGVEDDDISDVTVEWCDENYELIKTVTNGDELYTYTTEKITSNKTYICRIYDTYGACELYFYVNIDNGFDAYAKDDEDSPTNSVSVSIHPGESANLVVYAEQKGNTPITYNWINSATNESVKTETINDKSSSYSTGKLNSDASYYCQVTDAFYNSKTIYYYVSIDNDFKAYADIDEDGDYLISEKYFKVKPKQSVFLKAYADAYNKSGISYKWQRYDEDSGEYKDVDISGNEDKSEYTISSVESYEKYRCTVTDEFTTYTSYYLYYYVSVDNNLKAYVEGESTDTTYKDIYAMPGDNIKLSVKASADDSDSISYSWYDDELIEGAVDSTYTINNISEKKYIKCRVKDTYGNEVSVTFDISLDNGLYAYPEGVYSGNTKDLYVNAGSDVSLKVITEMDVDDKKTFTWYDNNYDEIDGQSTDTFKITDVKNAESYCCVVNDCYGNSASAYFNIHVQNGFKAYPEGMSSFASDKNIKIKPGENLSLKVVTEASDSEGIKFKWYDDNYDEIEGENTDTLSIVGDITSSNYQCYVSDRYNNSKSVTFRVEVVTNLTAYAENDGEVNVKKNENAVLNVIAESDLADNITYTWYDDNGDELENKEATLVVNNVNYYTEYYCKVSDGYNTAGVYFDINVESVIDDNLTAYIYKDDYNETHDSQDIEIKPGETKKLSVFASTKDNSAITYKWENYYTDEVLSETSNTLEIQENGSERYDCTVSDAKGNSKTLRFYIDVDNGFEARVESDDYSDSYTYRVDPGSDVTLKPFIKMDDESKAKYQWYDWNTSNPLTGENDKTLTLKNIRSNQNYRLSVDDGYGSEKDLYYYIYVKSDFDVYDKETESGSADFEIAAGSSKKLEVIVDGAEGAKFTYSWYDQTRERELRKETSSTFTTPKLNSSRSYRCKITDEYGNTKYVYYYISIKNELVAYANDNVGETEIEIEVEPLENVVLTANATATDDSMLTYTWEDSSYNVIQGEMSNTLTVKNIESSENYYCIVGDGYGNTVELHYYININNGFNAYIAGTDGEKEESYSVDAGTDLDLKTFVDAKNKTRVTYQWYKIVTDEDSYRYVAIRKATDATYSLKNISESGDYRCYIEDGFGNELDLDYSVSVKNNLKATVYGSDETYVTLDVKPNDSLTLKVAADASVKEFTYQWMREYDGDAYTINGETSDTFKTPSITSIYPYYSCVVSDCYGNRERVTFRINITNGFKAYIEGDENSDDASFFVKKGNPAQLKVVATADVDDKLTYEWSYYNSVDENYKTIDGENGDTLSIESVNGYNRYRCYVCDGYGSYNYLFFTVDVDNSDNAKDLVLGKTETFTATDEERTTWYKYTPSTTDIYRLWTTDASDEPEIKLYDSDKNVIDTDNASIDYELEEGKTYYYQLGFNGNRTGSYNFTFIKYVYNEFYAYINGADEDTPQELDVFVAKGGSAKLEVKTSGKDLSKVEYKWYVNDECIDEADKSSLNISNVDKDVDYKCIVQDGYGNSRTLYFYVSIDFRSEAQDIELNSNKTVNISVAGDKAAYKFVPELSGKYTFESSGNYDTYALLYDSECSGLDYNDDGGNINNFKIVHELEAGKTYYYVARMLDNDETGRFTVKLTYNGVIPTPTPTATATPTPTVAPTDEPTPTVTPTAAPTDEPTPTVTPTAAPTYEPTPTATPSAEPTAEPTSGPTSTPEVVATPTPKADSTATPDVVTTPTPVVEPTATPVIVPTETPTAEPTDSPTAKPTETPTVEPTEAPTASPTTEPSKAPTATPVKTPSAKPTAEPTKAPTSTPAKTPSAKPTSEPTLAPTAVPAKTPTVAPSPKTTKIDPTLPKAKGLKAKNTKSRKMVVSWKKLKSKQLKKIKGFEIQYSTDKLFNNSVVTKSVNKKKKSYTIKKLKKKTTYYVRIRTYKTSSGEKVYSNWSTVKKVKIKK